MMLRLNPFSSSSPEAGRSCVSLVDHCLRLAQGHKKHLDLLAELSVASKTDDDTVILQKSGFQSPLTGLRCPIALSWMGGSSEQHFCLYLHEHYTKHEVLVPLNDQYINNIR